METFLIITRSGSNFDVKQVEVDPHTTQGATALKDAINAAAVGASIFQIIKCEKKD
jgi:hypothetical protein